MKPLRLVLLVAALLLGGVAQGAQQGSGAPLFLKQEWAWMRPANVTAQVPVVKAEPGGWVNFSRFEVYGRPVPR